jgi:hypothetical protein
MVVAEHANAARQFGIVGLTVKLRYLPGWIAARREAAARHLVLFSRGC